MRREVLNLYQLCALLGLLQLLLGLPELGQVEGGDLLGLLNLLLVGLDLGLQLGCQLGHEVLVLLGFSDISTPDILQTRHFDTPTF